jgi:hypothetical protein
MRQNIDIFDFTLDEDEMGQLNRLATGERIGPDPTPSTPFNVNARSTTGGKLTAPSAGMGYGGQRRRGGGAEPPGLQQPDQVWPRQSGPGWASR